MAPALRKNRNFGASRWQVAGKLYQSPAAPERGRDVGLWQILLQKSFWGDERKFLEPLMRFTHGDVRDHIVSSKSITDLRSGAKERRSRREAQSQLSRDFLGCSIFDFCNNIGTFETCRRTLKMSVNW